MSITDSYLSGKLCLVTGGAGFIGSHLVDRLISLNCKVRVLDNFSTGRKENVSQYASESRFELVQGSVLKPSDVSRAMQQIDVVFHLACLGVRHSLVQPFENHRVNAEGTLTVLEEARSRDVNLFVYCSSSEVYGTAVRVPMNEDHPTRPCTVYGASKLAGECYTKAFFRTHNMPIVVIRPFNTFGPRSHHEGDAGELIPKSIVRALKGEKLLIFGDGSITRDFTYVTDTVRALALGACSEELVGNTYNVGSQFEISVKEVASMILGIVGNTKASIEYLAKRPGDVGRLFCDASQFMNRCNWKPQVSFEDGLRETVAYFRNHHIGIDGLLAQEKGRSWESLD